MMLNGELPGSWAVLKVVGRGGLPAGGEHSVWERAYGGSLC